MKCSEIDAIRQIVLSRRLVHDFGLTIERAAALANSLLSNGGEVQGSSGLTIRLELSAFNADIDRRLAEAVEAVVLARRGRPPRSVAVRR